VGVKENLVDRVVNEIQSQIMTGTLKPGMMLPPERELCEQLGVSRTALREAVRMLVTKGLLEPRRGVGTVVRQISSNQITESLSILMAYHDRQAALENVHQVRKILEVEIARLAAENATEEDIQTLKRILAEMQSQAANRRRFTELDNEFHNTLAATTHNPIIIILINSIQDLLREIRSMVENYPELVSTVMPDHQKIVESIQRRDAEAAAAAMTQHLEDARAIQDRYLR
jgi:GntR family transcriptional repressor for pyruvate dehydrogenase complex